ncbi:MAG: M24 family metallopeptidase [Alphaproteobacteria bacterium]|nr:M24 family metallopeptidase [Alphaproteobacteria bacterium]
MYQRPPVPDLTDQQNSILAQEWPRFSTGELTRRRAAIEAVMVENDVSYLLLYGAGGRGSAVPWLTEWSVTTEVMAIVTPGERDSLFIQYFNHTPFAERLISKAEVNWGGASTIRTTIEELKKRGAAGQRIGIIGGLPFGPYETLKEFSGDVVNLNAAYTKLRLVKSEEELDWFRIGAALSDLAIDALQEEMRPGQTEHELADIVEHSYVPHGGKSGIHFFGVTSMTEPHLYVPAQMTSNRSVDVGDIVFTEITASFWDYSGQVLRSFSVGSDPTPLYQDLHDTAVEAFDAIRAVAKPGNRPEDLIAAGQLIERNGFTICDDLIHGYGGGYFPPVLGIPSRREEPAPNLILEAGMMMVIQPNVITTDKTAGVQTGECVVVTEQGGVSLHRAPRGFLRV